MDERKQITLSDGTVAPLWRARCCRDWPVLGMEMGRCAYCNTKPVIVGPWLEDEPDGPGA